MKNSIRTLILVSATTLSSCGGMDTPDKLWAFDTGTYAVSNATATKTDQCGLLGAYKAADKVIGVSVVGTAVTFNLSNDPATPANQLPKAVLDGNSLTEPTEASYEIQYPTCTVQVKRSVVGTVTAAYKADVTLSFSVTPKAGTGTCGETDFDAEPCTSAYNFTITKK